MYPEADAFLDAIFAAPDDDTSRLVYADWLEEHDHADYAQFIRLSCWLARTVLPPEERRRLRQDRHLLGCKIMAAYPQAFETAGSRLDLHNYGLPSQSCAITAKEFLKVWPHWWPFFRPRLLTLLDMPGSEIAVVNCEYLSRVEILECEGHSNGISFDYQMREEVNWEPVDGGFLRELAANPTLGRLTGLKVEPIRPTADDLMALAESPLALRLDDCHLRVQFADGSYQDLRSSGSVLRQEIVRFVAEHGTRLVGQPGQEDHAAL
jgi:uncharacterized protein (TIGR02996 family)